MAEETNSKIIEMKINQHDTVVEKVYILNNNLIGTPPVITVDARELLSPEYRDESDSNEEPVTKKARTEDSCKLLLMEMQKQIFNRLRAIQTKILSISQRCQNLDDKIIYVSSQIQAGVSAEHKNSKSGSVVVGLPQSIQTSPGNSSEIQMPKAGPSSALITLNSEDDFPDGSWLGDENNPAQRVRCNISPGDLLNLNRTCPTPEKMALTLLDYLFDRETQARSNISGMGKHGKCQLDPLMIYGMRCHLVSKFTITDNDWHRIKQNLDSKCRTAFRRKQKGMPLTVKAFRDKWIPQEPSLRIPTTTYIQMVTNPNQNGLVNSDLNDSELTIDAIDLPGGTETINIPVHLTQPVSLMMEDTGEPQVIHMPEGDIQLVQATPEQLAHLRQNGLQVLAGNIIESSETLEDSP